MTVTRADVEHVAMLARLSLNEEEIAQFTRQLNDILEAVRRMGEVDTAGVPPTMHALDNVRNVFRADIPRPGLSREDVAKIAPAWAEGLFVVPKVVE